MAEVGAETVIPNKTKATDSAETVFKNLEKMCF
jgi:hypothetical protein